ncbi:BRCT domain-containing protein [Pluralibacter gergoviae]|nr:BRCT domain-containing protein [Pluralibacter gergoviae]
METICFTGFSKDRKNALITIAIALEFSVTKDVTKTLDYLCCGDNAGPSKINKAKQNGAKLLSEDEFLKFSSEIISSELPAQSKTEDKIEASVTIYDESDFLDTIWAAIDDKQPISIIYHGGTQKNLARKIVPLTLLENFTLRAVDLDTPTNAVKTFTLEKIEIPGVGIFTLPEHQRVKAKRIKKKKYSTGLYKNISDVHAAFEDTLLGMGWHVATYHDESGACNRLDVCDFFKNGKPRRTPVVSLSYQPDNSTRPFVCRCREIGLATAYTHLDNAAEVFISLAYAGSEEESEASL